MLQAFDFQVVAGALLEVLHPQIVAWIFLGSFVGLLFGATPGLTATTAVALFTPVTFGLTFTEAFAFLLGIYCCGYYSGSIPAILIKTPGAPGNAATTLDGYPMAQQGRAGEALFHSVFSSWIGGTFSCFCLFFFAPVVAQIAIEFGPQEYFSVALFGLSCIASISGKSMLKAFAAGCIGMFLGTIGLDPIDGLPRLTFGNFNMMRGIAIVPALVGLFAITEVLNNAEMLDEDQGTIITQITRNKGDMARWMKMYLKHKWLIFKCALMGMVIGAIPGTGPITSSWIAYNEAMRQTKNPELFGNGSHEGLMACESSNNAVTGGALIPLLTLGIPGDTVTAVLLGALTIQGLQPGPRMITDHYDIVSLILWILIIANIFMLTFGVVGSRFFPKILSVPPKILMPAILMLCVVGSYAVSNSYFDVKVAFVLGIVGFLFNKFEYPAAPMVLGLILGPIIEPNFRRAMIANKMNPSIFITSPISCAFLIIAIGTTVVVCIRHNKKQKAEKSAR